MVAPGTVQLGAPHYPVLEAMACGIPVITTGYMPASRENNNAWIVPIADADSIAQAILEAIEAPHLREKRKQKGLEDIQKFSWQAVAKIFLDLFENFE